MRGKKNPQATMFYAIDVDSRIRADHPLRAIKALVDQDLAKMSGLFDQAYAGVGRPSVPPESLLKAMLLQALFSIRSERQLVERIDTDLLFRWFLDMDPAADAFDATAFTHNRPRLDKFGITAAFFGTTVKRAVREGLASKDHFSVDGTLIESYASIKSFVPRDQADKPDDDDNNGFKSRNSEVDFHGQKRSNQTHISKTDGEALLYRKSVGQEARLHHLGHVITENRHGLVMGVTVTAATGTGEHEAALVMLDQLEREHRLKPQTCGGDKGYDSGPLMLALESRGITPHLAMRQGKVGGEHIARRRDVETIQARQRMLSRMAEAGYRLSQRARKKVEEAIGWIKCIGGMARASMVGRWKIIQQIEMTAAAYNLIRMSKLRAA